MKKIITLLTILSFICIGCTPLNNTPISKVEDLLNKYQVLDESVINELNYLIDNNYSDTQKEEYKKLIKEQYKELTYEIKDDYINGDNATVTVEIKVKDYYKAIDNIDKTYNYTSNNDEYINKIIDALKNVKDKVTYTIDFTLTKKNKEWIVDNLDTNTIYKLEGIAPY